MLQVAVGVGSVNSCLEKKIVFTLFHSVLNFKQWASLPYNRLTYQGVCKVQYLTFFPN